MILTSTCFSIKLLNMWKSYFKIWRITWTVPISMHHIYAYITAIESQSLYARKLCGNVTELVQICKNVLPFEIIILKYGSCSTYNFAVAMVTAWKLFGSFFVCKKTLKMCNYNWMFIGFKRMKRKLCLLLWLSFMLMTYLKKKKKESILKNLLFSSYVKNLSTKSVKFLVY